MNLNFDSDIAERYHSGAQIARVLTENWVCQNMYCPRCGNSHIGIFKIIVLWLIFSALRAIMNMN